METRSEFAESQLLNSEISELLATAAEDVRPPLQKALRRAARKALLWQQEASQLYSDRQSLTELPGKARIWTRLFGTGWNRHQSCHRRLT
jgi:hypothetical protein